MIDSVATTLRERLFALDTSLLSDILDEAGYQNQVVLDVLKPLDASRKLAGQVLTVRGGPRVTVVNPGPTITNHEIDVAIQQGTVIVMDTGSFTAGTTMGGFVATQFQRLGCVGVVTDGAVRDAREIREIGLPVYSKSVTPINGARRFSWIELRGQIVLPGQTGLAVIVENGDWILGDTDGLIVIPGAVAEEVVAMSEELARIERRIAVKMKAGGEREAVMTAHPRFKHVQCLRGR
ncbi:diguanylate cyclase [Betaproteobacteria bacterium]|nr:diguanylate cyclase [Betaproteobacteria bacterium]